MQASRITTNTQSTRAVRGFTLVELLVAMAIFSILAALLFTILSQVNRTWQQAQSRIEPRKSGRAILDYINRDLGAAALPAARGMTYGSPTAQPDSPNLNLQFLANPSQLTAATFLNPHALFWQAPIASVTTHGNLAEVGYFVRWDESNPNNPRAMLCRFFVNPGDTNYLIYSSPTNWLSDSILNSAAPGVKDTTTPANSYKGWFADNVIGLWARCLDSRGNPVTNSALNSAYANYAYDSRKGYRYQVGTNVVIKSGGPSIGTTNQILATLPASVEVALVILDSQAASRLTQKPVYTNSPPTATSFWTDINGFVSNLPAPVRSGARIYSTRVTLKNAD